MTQSHEITAGTSQLQPFQVAHHMQRKLLELILAAGAPEHIEVNYPMLRDTSSLGQWTGWSCGVRNEAVSLESFISRGDLYALFRQEFGQTDAALDHPAIQLSAEGESHAAIFREDAAGKLFVSTADSPCVMPCEITPQSAWSGIRFRLVTSTGIPMTLDNDAGLVDDDWVLEIEVNPFHNHAATEKRNLITKAQLVSRPVIQIALGTFHKPVFVPIAKVVGVSTHVAMLQLARDVANYRLDN